jgi:hypothetical protein
MIILVKLLHIAKKQPIGCSVGTSARLAYICLVLMLVPIVAGCSGDPPLHPVTGKVTVDGKSFPRLIIYMDPMKGPVTPFNKGVGETDASGQFKINSTGSTAQRMGLAAGEYRVYFNCWMQKGQAVGLSDEKIDESNRMLETEDIIPSPYNDPLGTPITFTVKAGEENQLDFDVNTRK